MSNNSLEVLTLRADNISRPVRLYTHQGRIFCEGKPNQTFSVKIKNNAYERKLAILSIDSINVIDGKVNSDAGYVIQGYNAYDVKGFRVSNDKVNSFIFAEKSQSYAAKGESTNHSTENCGVISLKLFSEKSKSLDLYTITQGQSHFQHRYDVPDQQWWFPGNPTITFNNDNVLRAVGATTTVCNYMSSVVDAPTPNFDLGTKFGNEISDSVTDTTFEKGELYETVNIYYASRQALISMGVDLLKETKVSWPEGFPGFCKPPR